MTGEKTTKLMLGDAKYVLEALAAMPISGHTGEIKCPKCGDKLSWRRTFHNKHRSGVCETEGCLTFRE